MVAVNIYALKWLTILAVNLLEYIERANWVTHLVNLNLVTNTTRDVTSLNTSIAWIVTCCQTSNLVLVIGNVETNLPTQVLLLDGHYIEGTLDTLILQVTYVHQQIVGKVGTSSYRNLVQQVLGLALINIDATIDAVASETEVQTNVIGSCLLPLNLSSIALWSDWSDNGVTELIERTCLVGMIGRNRRIVTLVDVLLTGDTITQTKLQV